MDPKANIREQLELAAELYAICEGDESIEANEMPDLMDVARLCELVIALHEWREKGGFDPYLSTKEGPDGNDR